MLRCCILSTQTIVGRQMLNSIVVVRMFCLPSAQLNAGVSVSIINPRSSRTSISADNFINIYNAKHSKYSKNGGADCKWNRISSRRRWCSCNYLCVFMWARNIAIFEIKMGWDIDTTNIMDAQMSSINGHWICARSILNAHSAITLQRNTLSPRCPTTIY